MEKKDTRFLVSQIIIDGRRAKLEDFDLVKNTDVKPTRIQNPDGNWETIDIIKSYKKIEEDRFILLYTEEGGKYPYPETVIDDSLSETKNPRPVNQIEMTEQFFVLIDIKTSRIFLSDQRKKKAFRDNLVRTIQKEVLIKPLIVEGQFLDKIKTIDEIAFTVDPSNMFAQDSGTLSDSLVHDIYGFGAEEATISMKYKKKKVSDKLSSLLKEVFQKKAAFKNITIVGRTSDKFESVFNMEEITSRITIETPLEQSTQKTDNELLFTKLISKIKSDED